MSLSRRLSYLKLFDKSKTTPKNKLEAQEWFQILACELSPENLACDGEATPAQIKAKLREIDQTWKELEALIGEKVSKSQFGI